MLEFVTKIKVRKLLVVMLGLIVVALATAHSLIMSSVWMPAIRRAEKDQAALHARSVASAIEAKHESMLSSTKDYAEWEAMYQYVTDTEDATTAAELDLNTLAHDRLLIDAIFIVKEDQSIGESSLSSSISSGIVEQLKNLSLARATAELDDQKIYLQLENKTLLVTICRAKSTTPSKPVSKGLVVQVTDLEQLLELNGLRRLPAAEWDPEQSYCEILAESADQAIMLHEKHASAVLEFPIADNSDKNLFVRMYTPLMVKPLFVANAPKSLLAAITSWLFVVLLVYFFVDKLVLRAFETLATKATLLAEGGWKKQEVLFRPRGTNEAAELANAINRLCRSQLEAYNQAVALYEQVQSNYENYRTIFRNSTSLMLITHGDHIVDYNISAARAISTIPDKIIGKPLDMLMTPLVSNDGTERLERTGEKVYTLNERVYLESVNEIKWGQKLCNLHTFADITELLHLQKSLVSAEKMQLLGEFSGGIAHDINNILGAILGYQQLIETLGPLNDEQLDSLRQQEAFVYKGSKLVRRLLQFAKNKSTARLELEIVTVIEEIIALVRAMLPKGVELGFQCAIPHQIMVLDQDDIFQLCMNLCVNASQAMHGRGKIEVTLSEDQPAFLNGSSLEVPDKDSLWLTVRDSGPGIPPEHLAELFQPFFTTKHEHGGTGLGLATVKRICDGYGWHVQAVNDGGAVFVIQITGTKESEAVSVDQEQGVVWFIERPSAAHH
jgi:signal transduction histidine kinase